MLTLIICLSHACIKNLIIVILSVVKIDIFEYLNYLQHLSSISCGETFGDDFSENIDVL